MMHEHDVDLVAAYADGSASPEEADQVATWLESCETCAEEFTAQELALDALASVGPATLTDFERAGLHRNVRETIAEIELDSRHRTAPEVALAPRPRRMTWLAGAAAAVVALVLAGGVLSSIGGLGDSSAEDFATAEATATTEAAAELAAESMDDSADTQMMEAEEEAAMDMPSAGVAESAILFIDDLGDISADTLQILAAPPVTSQTDTTRAEPLPVERPTNADDEASGPLMDCLDAGLSLLESPPTYLAVAVLDGSDIEIFQSEERLIVLVSNDCSVSVEFFRNE